MIEAGGKACGAGTMIGLGPVMPSSVLAGKGGTGPAGADAFLSCVGGIKGVSPTGGAWLTGAGWCCRGGGGGGADGRAPGTDGSGAFGGATT